MRRLDAEEDEVVRDSNLAAPDDDDARLVLLQALVGERAEVVAPDQTRGRVAHRVRVEAVLDPPDERLRERGAARGDLVEVDARDRVVAGGGGGGGRGGPGGGGWVGAGGAVVGAAPV